MYSIMPLEETSYSMHLVCHYISGNLLGQFIYLQLGVAASK